MAVVANKQVSRVMWGGLGDEFPIGMWYGQVDATIATASGNTTLTLEFAPASQANRDAQIYSLEQMNANSDKSASGTATLRARNLGLDPPSFAGLPGGQLNQIFVFTLSSSSAGDFIAGNIRDLPKGIMLGSQIDLSTQTGLQLIVIENDNNTGVSLVAMGYIWGSRARSIPGGPKRAPGAFFSGG